MTRGDEDIEGGAPKLCILLTQKEEGLLKNWTTSEGGY